VNLDPRYNSPVRTPPLLAGALAVLASCAPILPSHPIERALVQDTVRVVDVRQKVGWFVDEVEVQALLPDVMKSACRVTAPNRAGALAWMDAEIARQGGDPAEAWRRAGKDLDKVADLLLLSRARLVLVRADEWARAGKCPFWLEPEPAFDGVHVLSHRWTIGIEGGGRLIFGIENGIAGLGGGGGGRVLLGYGLRERLTLFSGLEAGGGARFTQVPIGEKAPIPDFVSTFAIPVIARLGFGLSGFVEPEIGFIAYFNQVEGRLDPGARIACAVGGTALRLQRGPLPRVAFALTIDHSPGWGGRPTVTQISAGFRAGFDLSR
jgi:hypothetical protein